MEIALVLVFLAAASTVLAVAGLVAGDPLRARVRALRGSDAAAGAAPGLVAEDTVSRTGQVLSWLARREPDPSSEAVRRLRQRLVQAGYRRASSVRVYFGSRVAFALLLPAGVLLSPLATSLDATRLLALALLAAVVGMVLPSHLVDRQRRRRQQALERGLPDALDLMVVCIESGLALTASLARVGQEYARSSPVLSQELELVALEIRTGKSVVDALRGLSARTGVADVSSLVAMLIQTERFGTSLADALRVQADGMRVRRLQRAEEAAAKAPIKMLFPAGLFIFPATVLVMAGPGVIRLVETITGN